MSISDIWLQVGLVRSLYMTVTLTQKILIQCFFM